MTNDQSSPNMTDRAILPPWTKVIAVAVSVAQWSLCAALLWPLPEGWNSVFGMPPAYVRLLSLFAAIMFSAIALIVWFFPENRFALRGYETLRRLRNHPLSPLLPIILVVLAFCFLPSGWWGYRVVGIQGLLLALAVFLIGHEEAIKRFLTSNVFLAILSTVFTFAGIELFMNTEFSQRYVFGVWPPAAYGVPDFMGGVHLNSWGFRDDEHTAQKPENVVRILVIGDSFVYGFGIPHEDRFTEALESMAGPQVEVIAIGATGRNTIQELELLSTGWVFEPDIVIIGVVSNDPAPSGESPSPSRFLTRIARLSTFFFLDNQINRLGEALELNPNYLEYEHSLYDAERPSFLEWQQAVHDMAADIEDHNVPGYAFVLVSPRNYNSEEILHITEQHHAVLTTTFSEAGFETHDLLPAYLEEYGNTPHHSLWAFPSDPHPNSEVHAFFAREIWTVIEPVVRTLQEGSISD